jgi:hypothetical protein
VPYAETCKCHGFVCANRLTFRGRSYQPY